MTDTSSHASAPGPRCRAHTDTSHHPTAPAPPPRHRSRKGAVGIMVAAALLLGGCAGLGQDRDPAEPFDPFEPANRMVFGINEGVDILFLEPAAETYRTVTPSPVRDAFRNFLNNLRSPILLANFLLQGDFEAAGDVTKRFLANTAAGAGGFFDVAALNGVEHRETDFGQTLATWGVGHGPYIVLPLLGPSSVRDTAGRAVDTLADPVSLHASNQNAEGWNRARTGLTALDTRTRLLEPIRDLRRNSVDYYSTQRSIYFQNRAAMASGLSTDAMPDFEDFEDIEGMDAPPDSGAGMDGMEDFEGFNDD